MSEIFYLVVAIASFIIIRMSSVYVFPELNNYGITFDMFLGAIVIFATGLSFYMCSKDEVVEKFTNEEMDAENKKGAQSFLDDEYSNPKDKALQEKKERDAETEKKIKAKYKNEMKYDNGNALNTVPLGEKLYENDYVYLPPSNWMRPFERPPVCLTEKRCPVCPGYTTGTEMNLLQFHDGSGTAVAEIKIDNDYINKK